MRVLPLLRSAVKPFRFLRSRGGNNRRSVRGNVGDWQGLQQLEPRVMLSGGNLIDPDAIGWSSFEDLTATQFADEVDEQHADYMLVDIEDPDLGTVHNIGVPVKLSATPGQIRTRAPMLGEHSAEVLLEHGFSQVEVDELFADRVVSGNLGPGTRQ